VRPADALPVDLDQCLALRRNCYRGVSMVHHHATVALGAMRTRSGATELQDWEKYKAKIEKGDRDREKLWDMQVTPLLKSYVSSKLHGSPCGERRGRLRHVGPRGGTAGCAAQVQAGQRSTLRARPGRPAAASAGTGEPSWLVRHRI
jgi:hypothetical protein